MKRPNRSDTLTVVDQETPICLSVNNDDEEKLVYKKRLGCFQTLLDNLGEEDDILRDGDGGCGALGEKKRRLKLEQVKALEKNFEVENKLEPERKAKLAEELGLQPRQVAVWFQNRRARWKTKQLERDYGILKAEYESLELDHEALRSNNEALLTQIKELKTKVEDGSSVKDVTLQLVKNEELMKTRQEEEVDVKENDVEREEEEEGERSLPALIYKDGSSDSDASVILNDDGNGGINSSSPSGVMSNLRHHPQQQMCFIGNDDCSSSSPFQFLEESSRGSRGDNYQYYFQHHQQKEEEERMLAVEQHMGHDFLNDGGSSIFSDEQVPDLPWYHCSDQWT